MALSEEEQRLLDELERGLYQSDVDIVKASTGRSFDQRRILFGVLIAVLGISLLIVGISIQQPLIGLGGFVIMFVGALYGLTGKKQDSLESELRKDGSAGPQGGTSKHPKESWQDRANRRWDDSSR